MSKRMMTIEEEEGIYGERAKLHTEEFTGHEWESIDMSDDNGVARMSMCTRCGIRKVDDKYGGYMDQGRCVSV